MNILKLCVLMFICWTKLALADELTKSKIEANQDLLQLLKLSNINHDGTLKDIVLKTQKEWLRKGERWDVKKNINGTIRAKYLDYFKALGYTKQIKPNKKFYHKILLLGTNVKGFRKRLRFLSHAYKNGLRFNEIVLLGSDRPLNLEEENDLVLYDENNPDLKLQNAWKKPLHPLKTELDAMMFLMDFSDIPEEIKQTKRVIVKSGMKVDSQGKVTRATTPDTIKDWLKLNHVSPHTSCLAISNQPYCQYQHLVILNLVLSKDIELETVGEGSDLDKANIYIYLDSLARHLYMEQECRQTLSNKN